MRQLPGTRCNGKFGEAVEFPIWSGPIRGPWNLGVVTGIVPRGVTCGAGRPVTIVSEHSIKCG